MKKVLIVSGHTDLKDSVANNTVLDELKRQFPEAKFSILSELYPDFRIDVAAEQQKLVEADVIVWQFPVFWYSLPSMLHRWVEEVCVHGFAHGSTGTALKGKKLIASFTTGATADWYSHEALGYTVDEILMSQIKATASLCQLDLQDYVYTGGVSYALRTDPEQLANIKALARRHADRLAARIRELTA